MNLSDLVAQMRPVDIAGRVGVSPQRLHNWIVRDSVPAAEVIEFCRRLDWRCRPHDLRPDVYPHPDDGLPFDLRARVA